MMKTIFTTFVITVLLTGSLWSQETTVRKIEVNGSATMEIVPDIFSFRIDLREYIAKGKKVTLDDLERDLVKALKKEDIPDTALTVDNVYGYNWNYKKKESDVFMASKSFRLKLPSIKGINDLLERLDSEGVSSVNIIEASHSNMYEYQMEMRKMALKNAKRKAEVMLETLGESLGRPLEIQDQTYEQEQPVYRMAAMAMDEAAPAYKSNVEYKNISVKSSVRVVFEIN